MKKVKSINADDSGEIRDIIINAVDLGDDLNPDYQTGMVKEFIRELQLRDDDTDNIIQEIADSYTETYDTKVLKLYADNPNLLYYAQEAKNSGITSKSIVNQLRIGQFKYNKFILNSVADYLLD